jgi:hypothetical protein
VIPDTRDERWIATFDDGSSLEVVATHHGRGGGLTDAL